MYMVSFDDKSTKNSTTLPPLSRKSDGKDHYTLSNTNINYNMPPKRTIRSSDDMQLGVIDSWPAHSANQRPSNVHISLNRNHQLMVTNELAEGKAEITPKPKFLENLEKFLQRELKLLDGYSDGSQTNEARLQAYREVFEYLLDEFKTYRPILSSIKNEYEMMLAVQREKIRELEPLKQMLVTLADQCDNKLMQYREEEKLELKAIREEKKRLLEMIAALQNDKQTLQVQLEKLQNELMVQHEKYRNEYDKRKLLISDLNDLRFQQEEARLAELKREKRDDENAEDVSNDDPITLKIALRVCRKSLNDSMKRLIKMEADYGEVVPRRDYLALETAYNEIKERTDRLESEHSSLKIDYTTLKDYSKNLENKMQEISQELDIMRSNNTPRPDWERCNTLIEVGGTNGEEKWKDLTANKSSIQILDTLINELNGTHKKDFIGLGTGSDVPVYLRHEGKIKNLNMSRREVCKLITTILTERMQQKKDSSDEPTDMKVFLVDFLKRKYPHEAYEYSYTIHDAFSKYSHEFIKFFEAILKGEIDEQIYFQERKCISIILDQLKDIDNKDQSNGIVSKNVLREVLKPFFKRKTLEELNILVKTAEEDSELTDANKIDYKAVFSEESEDTISNFLVMFKSYLRDERLTLANMIKENLEKYGTVSPAELRKAISSADSTISDKSIEKISSWCLKGEKQVDLVTVKQRLDNACLYNHPRK